MTALSALKGSKGLSEGRLGAGPLASSRSSPLRGGGEVAQGAKCCQVSHSRVHQTPKGASVPTTCAPRACSRA
jgi:hypothetical protein